MKGDDEDDLPLECVRWNPAFRSISPAWRRSRRYPIGTRVAPEVREMARAQTRHTGEHLHEFLARLIREELERKPVPLD